MPPRVIFILPFAGPNSGKSFIWKKMQALITNPNDDNPMRKIQPGAEWSFASISSDGIRGEETEKLMRQKKMPRGKAFEMSRKPANKAYHQAFVDLIDDTASLKQG